MDFAASSPLRSGAAWDTPSETEGCPTDFEEVYRSYAPMVRRAVWSLGGAQDLDDIVQDVFVRLWRNWDRFDGRSDRRTWIFRITVNTARGHWRGRGRFKAMLQRFFLAAPRSESVAPGQEAWELDSQLARALGRLEARQREALVLVHLEGLSVAEAAEAMDVPEGTVKSRLFHARARMQALLKECDHGEA